MPDVVIRESEVKQLDDLIKKVPTEWGFGLVVYFQNINAKRQQEAQAEKQAEDARIALQSKTKELQSGDEDEKQTASKGKQEDLPF